MNLAVRHCDPGEGRGKQSRTEPKNAVKRWLNNRIRPHTVMPRESGASTPSLHQPLLASAHPRHCEPAKPAWQSNFLSDSPCEVGLLRSARNDSHGLPVTQCLGNLVLFSTFCKRFLVRLIGRFLPSGPFQRRCAPSEPLALRPTAVFRNPHVGKAVKAARSAPRSGCLDGFESHAMMEHGAAQQSLIPIQSGDRNQICYFKQFKGISCQRKIEMKAGGC